MSKTPMTLTVGTRKSELALVQTRHVIAQLTKHHPEVTCGELGLTTTGDAILNSPLSRIGTKALFTKELEVALQEGTADLVVHSLKDLGTTLPEDLVLGVTLEREDPADALVLRSPPPQNAQGTGPARCLGDLAAGSVIGTSSVRRIAQLKRAYPHLEFADIRGNLNTRLRKLDDSAGSEVPYAGLVLAQAGLSRLGWEGRVSERIDPRTSLYAVGQGALAVECRAGDERVLELLRPLEHRPTRLAVEAERAIMRTLEGGCSVPIGVHTSWGGSDGATLHLLASVTSRDGTERVEGGVEGHVEEIEEAQTLGHDLAQRLLAQGARSILDAITSTRG